MRFNRHLLALAAVAALAGSPTFAADIPGAVYRAPVVAPMPATYNWTGIYLGGNDGYAGGAFTSPGTDDLTAHGFTGGGHGGFNAQWQRLVVGIEGDYSLFKLTHSESSTCAFCGPVPVTSTFDLSAKDLWSVRGRLGFAADNWLLYVTGGYAGSKVEGVSTISSALFSSTFSQSATTRGPIAGVGIEWAFWQDFVARLEGLYTDQTSDDLLDAHTKMAFVRFGISYMINPFR